MRYIVDILPAALSDIFPTLSRQPVGMKTSVKGWVRTLLRN